MKSTSWCLPQKLELYSTLPTQQQLTARYTLAQNLTQTKLLKTNTAVMLFTLRSIEHFVFNNEVQVRDWRKPRDHNIAILILHVERWRCQWYNIYQQTNMQAWTRACDVMTVCMHLRSLPIFRCVKSKHESKNKFQYHQRLKNYLVHCNTVLIR